MASTKNLFEERLRIIAKVDERYHINAYKFIYEALDFCIMRIGKKRHVTGKELLYAVRDLGVKKFGFLARVVFENWGLKETRNFGEIVFNLVNAGLMGKTAEDSLEDFADVYDFKEVFEDNFKLELPPELTRYAGKG
ncbi:MAG: Minf_1886 family protein [Planctomycetota bacterium]